MKYDILMFTDGGCAPNPGKGGYGVILQNSDKTRELVFSEGFENTTNNRMEFRAFLKGLFLLKKDKLSILLTTDSSYVIKVFDKLQSYNRVPLKFKNPDLCREFFQLRRNHIITMNWVKGHVGHIENERCDVLATEARLGENLLIDEII